jgi:hypothetical protein
MWGEWIDAICRWVRPGFGIGFGHRGRLIPGVRACFDASDLGVCHACGHHAVAHHGQDSRALHRLGAPHQQAPGGDFRGSGEVHRALHPR